MIHSKCLTVILQQITLCEIISLISLAYFKLFALKWNQNITLELFVLKNNLIKRGEVNYTKESKIKFHETFLFYSYHFYPSWLIVCLYVVMGKNNSLQVYSSPCYIKDIVKTFV